MATREEIFTAKIMINDAEAENKLQKMKQHLAELKKKREEAFANDNVTLWKTLDKEINSVSKKIDKQETLVKGLNHTLDKMSTAKQKELKQVIAAINKQLDSGAVERNSKQWKDLNAVLKDAKSELHKIRAEGENQPSIWSKFFKVLNDSWGGLLIIFQSITGLSQTVRNAVKDFASMEEAMANTRKYTGLTDGAIRDLNEDLKKMDTRTSREELNELAGAAGRLGITGKEGILDFVEAGNMIKVALGDDLGEGAIDKVGKLAMAFGEDEKMGLRGAMIATGSAINELAQNSSAQAGYLVDFTARVAGFGKQLGLTQAQIMGFGAVMDENLLRDEMAATAFGNMLTKMQTDTAKFAKIAGMDVKKFTDLLNTDANAAILALADNLKKADPQTMMKMLDDMGLDGSRAVGVLSTLADKIDDVRQRQELATQAYKEQQSVVNEYNTMNNTVEAQLEKTKKEFHELVVTLGGQLLPIVSYTISAGGMLAKIISTLTNFVMEHKGAIVFWTAAILANTAVYKAHAIVLKAQDVWLNILIAKEKLMAATQLFLKNVLYGLQAAWALLTKGVQGYTVVMRAARIASATNPWGALVTAILAVGTAIYGVISALKAHSKAAQENLQKMVELRAAHKAEQEINKQVSESIAERKSKVEQLTRIINSNRFSIDERRKAIKTLQGIVPKYHASIDKEGRLFQNNTAAIKEYVENLIIAAKAEAIYQKKIEIEKKLLELNMQKDRIEFSLKSVYAYRDAHKDQMKPKRYYGAYSTAIDAPEDADMQNSLKQEAIHKERLKTNEKETLELNAQNKFLDQQLTTNIKLNKEYEKRVNGNNKSGFSPSSNAGGSPVTSYTTDKEEKQAERERKKREQDEKKLSAEEKKKLAEKRKLQKKQADEAKATLDEEIACEMESYRMGASTYTDYMEERHRITQNYFERLKAIYGEDSDEYRKQLDNRESMEDAYYNWKMKQDEQSLEIEKLQRDANIREQFMSKEVYDEDALNEALFQSDMDYLRAKRDLYNEGSQKWEEIQTNIAIKEEEHRLQLRESYIKRLQQYREEMGRVNYQELLNMELESVEKIYKPLVDLGKMTKDEYDAIIAYIKQEYASLAADQTVDNDIQNKAAKNLETAKKKAGTKDYGAGDNAATGVFGIMQAVSQQKTINEELKKLYGEDYENNREYQEAKRQLDAETMQKIVAGAQAAYSSINTMISASSSYAQACSDLEVAKITADYDKQIAAAGKNSKKKEKLEKKKDEAIAKAKTKANKKAMKMELAQAIAQTAMGAISAYTSTMAGAPYPANLVLAPISAGIALAAGMLQVGTIKKQHQAESTGYYEGGYTGGRQYRKEAGVVHEGEFVANHKAVNNRELRPVLNLIDQAQRHNRVASLRAEDVTKVMGGTAAAVVAPVVNVQTDNEELRSSIDGMNESMDRLNYNLENPRDVVFSMERFDREQKKWNRMKSNV